MLTTLFALFKVITTFKENRNLYLKYEGGKEMKKKSYRMLVLLLVLLFVSGIFISCKKEETQELTERQKAWITDIDGQMREAFSRAAGINEYVTDEERNERLDILINKIKTENWSDNQIEYYIYELISDFHIAHIEFYKSNNCISEDNYLCYPIAGEWFGEDFYILGTQDYYSDCIGSKLVAINETSLKDVLICYDEIISNETDNYLKSVFEIYTRNRGFRKSDLVYFGIIDSETDDVLFTFEKDGKQYEQVISPVITDGSQKLNIENVSNKVEKLPYGYEIYTNNYLPFHYAIDKENRALYFQYNECMDASILGEDSGYPYFDKFIDQMIQDMKENEDIIDCFVLDLRNNGGGAEILWNEAVKKYYNYLNEFPIKILIGKATFSAGVDAIDTTLYYFDDVTLYGEETGLAIHNYTEKITIELKNTGYLLDITDHKDDNAVIDKRTDNVNKGVLPDVEVSQSYEDFINGVDTVYNKAVLE